MKRDIKKISAAASSLALSAITSFKAYALDRISRDVSADEFTDMDLARAPGVILGITFWVLRLIGILLFIFGIYSITSCRKDGDADGINTAWIKVIAGALFVAMPTIMHSVQIIE